MSFSEMSLSAGTLILLTALLRRVAGARLPRRTYVALWDIALARLLVPWSLPWRFSPQVWVSRFAHVKTGAMQAVSSPVGVHTGTLDQAVWVAQATGVPRSGTAPINRVLAVLWVVGAALLAAYFLRTYCISLRAFAQSLPDEDSRTADFLRENSLRWRTVRVRTSGYIAAPLSYGVFRPVILLPKGMDRRDTQALCFVLTHEMAHIRALDALRKVLLVLALCLHWMNPAVYIMFLLVNRDMELLCDERVIARCGADSRKAYALTLLQMEVARGGVMPLTSSFSITGIEERIKAMKHVKKKNAFSAVLAAALVCASGVALATGEPAQTVPSANATAAASASDVKVQAQETGDLRMTKENWQAYSRYEPYGLGYDEALGRLTYAGKIVRMFEDMYSVGEGTYAGTVCRFPDGEVDVYAVRDLTAPIVRNADGSFDPSGVLTGLRAATQAEFDAKTEEMKADDDLVAVAREDVEVKISDGQAVMNNVAADAAAQEMEGIEDTDGSRAITYSVVENAAVQAIGRNDEAAADMFYFYSEAQDGMAQVTGDAADGGADFDSESQDGQEEGQTVIEGITESRATTENSLVISVDAGTSVDVQGVQRYADENDIEWWTAKEYEDWMHEQRNAMEELARQGQRAYTGSTGWFTWTQDVVEETMAVYEEILEEIKSGIRVSKPIAMDEGGEVVVTQGVPADKDAALTP